MNDNTILSPSQVRQLTQEALKGWSETEAAQGFARLAWVRQRMVGERTLRQITNQLLLHGLELLRSQDERLARLLRLRYLDGLPVDQVANQLNLADATIFELQRQGFERLANILHKEELSAQRAQQERLAERLEPATYSQLIGIDSHLQQLVQLLASPTPPWLIAIEGTGGIGKTSLTDALLRKVITASLFADIGWITARTTRFDLGTGLIRNVSPALSSEGLVDKLAAQLSANDPSVTTLGNKEKQRFLHRRLKEHPHLIVVDNLETLEDVSTLLPLLQQLSNPSKFLLTSRQYFAGEQPLYHYQLPPLSSSDSLALVRHEAALCNQRQLTQASDADLYPIYQTVGGNPLALRLVIGQTNAHSLDIILADLQAARGATTEHLYRYLFRSAWDRLEEAARLTWLALPLVDVQSATVEHLVEVTEMDGTAVCAALGQLVRLNLVDAQVTLHEQRYTIHNLTRTFLQEQVAKWQI